MRCTANAARRAGGGSAAAAPLLPACDVLAAPSSAPPPTSADFSKNEYEVKWGQDCWWGKDVYAYGDAGLKRDHPVLAFLAKDG